MKYRAWWLAAKALATIAWGAPIEHRLHSYPSPAPLDIVHLARDRYGLIWMAAKQGVFRFDGTRYLRVGGFPFASASWIGEDFHGRVWAGGNEGLARYENQAWSIVHRQPVTHFAVTSREVWYGTALSLEAIDTAGRVVKLPAERPDAALTVARDEVWFPCGEQRFCVGRDGQVRSKPIPLTHQNWQKVFPDAEGQTWFTHSREIANESGLRWVEPGYSNEPYRSPAGKVWTTRGHRTTIPAPLGWWRATGEDEPCTLFRDERSRWVPLLDGKLALIERTAWNTWGGRTSGGPLNPGAVLPRKGLSPLIASSRGLTYLRTDSLEFDMFTKGPAMEIDDGIESPEGLWVTSRERGILRIDGHGNIVETHHPCKSLDTYRSLAIGSSGALVAGGKDIDCFFSLSGGPQGRRVKFEQLPTQIYQATDIQKAPDGRLWVGYESGLAAQTGWGSWELVKTSLPVEFIRNFEFDGKDAIWVSHRRPGFFSRLERSGDGWRVRRFTSPEYGPPDTHYLHVDSRGWIWRGTLLGVYVAKRGSYDADQWLHLNEDNGLASTATSNGGWAEDGDGFVWLTGPKGVTKIKPEANWFDAPLGPPPVVARVRADGKEWTDPGKLRNHFARGTTLEIELSTIGAAPFRAKPLRYRLSTDAHWVNSGDGSVKLSPREAGNYVLEASYSGEGQAPVMRWVFTVGNPLPVWFPYAGIGLAGGVVFWAAWRRRWLRYWISKHSYSLNRNPESEGEAVPFQNYSGRTFLNRYQVVEPISRGGFSLTYSAFDLVEQQKVAVKVLHRAPGQESDMRRRFAQEVAALHSLRHPGIVRLLDSWIAPSGEPCLAMPFLDGPTLRKTLSDRGALPAPQVADLAEQLASALAAIHTRGVVHRDLKPENIMLVEGRAVIIDFGTSAVRGPEEDLERTTSVAGSLHYLAPERLAHQYSPASDTYSLGVVILEALTGKRPADFDASPTESEFPEMVRPWIDLETTTLLVQALRHQPSRRPSDILAWATEIAQRLRGSRLTS